MNHLFRILFLAVVVVSLLTACNKADKLPFYSNGTATTLSSSTTTIAPQLSDSDKVVLTLSWTNPKYAVDSSTVKYVVQIDSSGRNFSKAVSKTVTGAHSVTYTAKELNAILVGYGFAFNTPYDVDVRVMSSYANNNEQYVSNTVKIKMTAYITPPKVVPPDSKTLFLVGSATAGGWDNPVPVPAQQFTRLDSVTYQGTFFLNGGGQYVFLPVNGVWDHKFNIADAGAPGIAGGGVFGEDLGSANIPGPAATGMYTIKVDFQHGTFSVANVSVFGLLWVPGDYQGWTPATAPQIGSPKNDGNYEGYINIPAGGTLEFKLTTTPDWSNAIGNGGSGTLTPGGGGNLTVPAGGYYHLTANTTSNTWSATKTTWSIIGSFAASGWNNDIPMIYSTSNNNWTATITTVAGDQFKFRANNAWDLNYGDNDGMGSLVGGGANIGDPAHTAPVTAGNHTITLSLNNPGYYTFSIQ